MGVERGGKEHEAAVQRILKAAKAEGKKAAIFCTSLLEFTLPPFRWVYWLYAGLKTKCSPRVSTGTDGADAKKRTDQGFDMVSIITDVNVLGEGIARELSAAQAEGASAAGGSKVY